MADIDVKINTSNKYVAKASLDALYGEILAIAISVAALAGDYLTGGNIVKNIIASKESSLIGAGIFIVLTIIGETSNHLDKTHSLLALLLFTLSVCIIDFDIGIAFAIGYVSHLFIDFFNKKDICLFYPLKKGFCLKICYADRLGDEMILIDGVFIIVLYIFLHSLL